MRPASGIPCALQIFGGDALQNSGSTCRGNAESHPLDRRPGESQDPLPQAFVVQHALSQSSFTDRFRGMGPGFRQDDSGSGYAFAFAR